MKLMMKQYLASLRERGELDAMLPDLLSESGYTVISKPSIGTKQYGVDVAAIGTDGDGDKKVFLFTIKAGNLTRRDWDRGDQSVRPSLNEIRDYYIPNLIPKRYNNLRVVICVCFGGDMHEGIRGVIEGYFGQNSSNVLEYQEWNGDYLAELLVSGILRENALPKSARSSFRKSVAMLDEPDVSVLHYRELADDLLSDCKNTKKAQLTVARQLTLSLWTLFIWSRDAGNYEAPFLCSELAVLRVWKLVAPSMAIKSVASRALREAFGKLLTLHQYIATSFVRERIIPNADTLHGLTSAVPSPESLDANLKLFEFLGRLAMCGIWLHFSLANARDNQPAEDIVEIQNSIQKLLSAAIGMINNNPTLSSPIRDDHAIEISLACMFFEMCGRTNDSGNWVSGIAARVQFAFDSKQKYPCIFQSYRDLLAHPKSDDGYREEATSGSVLIPTLAIWAAKAEDTETLSRLTKFTADSFSHSTLQLWFPGADTEAKLYAGELQHGIAVTDLKIRKSPAEILQIPRDECEANDHFDNLSAVKYGFWPIVLIACRHYRIPVPPQLWTLPSSASPN